jgi:hypothetical protein
LRKSYETKEKKRKRYDKEMEMVGKTIGKIGKVKVILVDGTNIRNNKAVNFVFGGNDMAYSFIPKNQIWIENAVPTDERKFILIHEFSERDLMKHGMGYDHAHLIANQIEDFQRKIEKVI